MTRGAVGLPSCRRRWRHLSASVWGKRLPRVSHQGYCARSGSWQVPSDGSWTGVGASWARPRSGCGNLQVRGFGGDQGEDRHDTDVSRDDRGDVVSQRFSLSLPAPKPSSLRGCEAAVAIFRDPGSRQAHTHVIARPRSGCGNLSKTLAKTDWLLADSGQSGQQNSPTRILGPLTPRTLSSRCQL
jgi:hypothetical protein